MGKARSDSPARANSLNAQKTGIGSEAAMT
nr:MAG TPA: hypothetical protein [Caudoviricetes sp.]